MKHMGDCKSILYISILLWKITILKEKTHISTGPFSIAMCVYKSVISHGYGKNGQKTLMVISHEDSPMVSRHLAGTLGQLRQRRARAKAQRRSLFGCVSTMWEGVGI